MTADDNDIRDRGSKSLQPIETAGELLPPTPRIELRDARAIRREMASVYREARAGRIETQDATRLVYILDMIRKAYETGVLQGRIENLEHTLKQRRDEHET